MMDKETRKLLQECHEYIDAGIPDFEKRMELCERLHDVLRPRKED